ncbi:hydrolase [Sporomusa termitida]|uniref:Vibriobactin-specific isochorismatase n=1 Tax=Sporomusa termitida TaxID=2377 RepID=A0A517DUL3_9FIRM|nr:hydrolase [Sporomusa termitida]QDR81053.1 Vibriobactin-specific isochorismatase [Sporomusa termitida]
MRIEKENALLLVVDMQEKLFPHINRHQELIKKTLILLAGLKALAVPMMAARQYPRGLGDTIEELRPYFTTGYWDKLTFSCCGSEPLLAQLQGSGRKAVIIAGIEAHICVLQTVIDLKEHGLVPVVVTDAVGSRTDRDYEIALRRMEQAGAVLTTVESILFELCRQAGSEAFKTISKLVK